MNNAIIESGNWSIDLENDEIRHESFLYSLLEGKIINEFELQSIRQSTGLSTSHIRRKWYLSDEQKQRQLAGELLNREYIQSVKGKIELSINGNWARVKVPVVKPIQANNGGGERGDIKGFSENSRRRMMRFISKLENVKKPLFFTLTYPDEFGCSMDGGVLKEKHLKNFWKRLEYKYPDASAVWKLEYKERKSGENVGELYPHFHLLVWGIYSVDIEEIREFVSLAWWEVAGKLSEAHLRVGTRVERLRSINGVMAYVAKYMGKEETQDLEVGRFWGVKNRKNLPVAEVIVIDFLEKQQYLKVINFLRNYANLPDGEWRSLQVFIDGNKLLQMLDFIIFPDV